MSENAPKTIYLKDYAPPAYLVDAVDLRFELGEESSLVHARLDLRRNPAHTDEHPPLELNGQDLALEAITLNGDVLAPERYTIEDETLRLSDAPDEFTLGVVTRIRPQDNTALEGLYKSNDMFCTQCEAEGFRRITYFPDRPDVMARFTTTVVADRRRYPVLLSNGNPVEAGDMADGRHWVRWQDPFPKPSYLFALVAGDLVEIGDNYLTRSGREVDLRIYVEPANADKCRHAMASLKQAMAWDERVFGLEYDLDIYMIVAVDHFNMGAMENKGLNVFNSKYVLASPETATDMDYVNIQGVIGHEYFHNWTGNRVTCRDWFQLSLKEGLTVFRDQEFTADMNSRPVKRIQDVRQLRTAQFAEDGGPMAHPIRPEAYIEINNFYTLTVYEKGAEVIRMIHTLLGGEGFKRGMELYFQRHDGQAVTTEDFVAAMADATETDLTHFQRWYGQAGTPELTVTDSYDAATGRYSLHLHQKSAPTPGQPEKLPLHIPVAIGLLGPDGEDLPLQLAGEAQPTGGNTRVLELHEREQTFHFVNLRQRPLPSLLRGFSAPARLQYAYSDQDLAFLMAHDPDPFNRWDAGQRLATTVLLGMIRQHQNGEDAHLPEHFIQAFAAVLANRELDRALATEALTLPSETYLAQQMAVADVDAIHAMRNRARRELAGSLAGDLLQAYQAHREQGPYRIDPLSMGRRMFRNLLLAYLVELGQDDALHLCLEQFHAADNMTDVIGALGILANTDCEQRPPVLAEFYRRWRHDPLVLDKWFAIQATSRLPGTLNEVTGLLGHADFDIGNPNRVRAVVGAFCHGNPVRFHDSTGAGYRFLADQVLRLDPLNPQIAARLLGAMSRWRRFDAGRQGLMRAELERIAATPALSKDAYEVATKSLA